MEQAMPVFTRRRLMVVLLLLGLFFVVLITLRYGMPERLGGQSSDEIANQSPSKKNKPSLVRVVKSQRQDVEIWRDIPATVTPLQQVVIRPQVSGQIRQLLFQEGQFITTGQPLVQLDDRSIRAEIDRLQAVLQGIAVEREAVRRDQGRYQSLLKDQAVSRQEVDHLTSQVRQLDAQYAAAQADIRVKQVQLSQTLIEAPFSGRVGLRQAAVGAQVSSSDANGIATLTQTQPIAVNLGLSEALINQQNMIGLAVELWSMDQAKRLASGQISIRDTAIDTATGNLMVRAVFDNADERLVPNQSVRARVRIKQLMQVVTVPITAVQQGLHEQYVMAVQGGHVKRTPVTVTQQTDDLMVVTGLVAGEQVVIDGLLRLKDGAAVKIQKDQGAEATVPATQGEPSV
jgi:multidrug efflux system membrane fusion protein